MIARTANDGSRNESMNPGRTRFQFSLRQLILAVICCGLFLGLVVSILPAPLTVEQALALDCGLENPFNSPEKPTTVRSIATVKGSFPKDIRVRTRLFLVRLGACKELGSISFGRRASGHSFPEFPWRSMTFQLVFGESQTPAGRITELNCTGDYPAGGGSARVPHHIEPRFTQLLVGLLPSGRDRVIYVEGDVQPQVDSDMSLEEFTLRNNGNYLVVTAGE